MFSYFFYFYCAIQPFIIQFYIVLGKREPLQRFIVEDSVKPPIIGSYSYDPITQLFDIPEKNETTANQFYNTSHVLSTAISGDINDGHNRTTTYMTFNTSNIFLRKQPTLSNMKTTKWWARPKANYKYNKSFK